MSTRKNRPFVKAADTKTPVGSSRSEVDRLLRRYGASAISVSENISARTIVVSFVVPNSLNKGAGDVPVRMPIAVTGVYVSLYGRPKQGGYDAVKMARAERVAWRNLVLWLDAALSAASVGLQTITEAFFAHAVASIPLRQEILISIAFRQADDASFAEPFSFGERFRVASPEQFDRAMDAVRDSAWDGVLRMLHNRLDTNRAASVPPAPSPATPENT